MISDLLLVVGVGILSAALRTFHHPAAFRAGTFGLVATSFLAGWLLGGSLVLGFIFAATWFLLPWLEILTRVRRMRLPLDRRLEESPPPTRATFPMFQELTDEIEAEGFEYLDDASWSHADTRQFFRLFKNSDTRAMGSICFVEQAEFAFYYISVTSRTADGRVFLTWNYPFSFGLRLPPNYSLQRVPGDRSISSLIAGHEERLKSAGLDLGALRDPAAGEVMSEMQRELRAQLDHNLACGLLKKDGPDMIRYSVRGMFFLWFQFLRDFVRFS